MNGVEDTAFEKHFTPPDEEEVDRVKVFHAHLDVCSQCENHPFALCTIGAKLLKEAATGPQLPVR